MTQQPPPGDGASSYPPGPQPGAGGPQNPPPHAGSQNPGSQNPGSHHAGPQNLGQQSPGQYAAPQQPYPQSYPGQQQYPGQQPTYPGPQTPQYPNPQQPNPQQPYGQQPFAPTPGNFQGPGQPPFPPGGPFPGSFPGSPPLPYPSPRSPRGNGGVIAAVVGGVIAVVAIAALIITVGIQSGDSSDDELVAPTTTLRSTPDPDTGQSRPSQSDVSAIRTAMQAFVDAVNSRDVSRIQAAVCSSVRPQVTKPLDITGNVVLEDLSQVTITGDTAESKVSTHVELGNQRSTTKQNEENFARENGVWFVCPGSEPDIGT